MRRLVGAIGSLGMALLLFGPARAEVVVIDIQGSDGETTWTDRVSIDVGADGTFFGQGSSETTAWNIDFLVSGETDPVLVAHFSAQNLLAVPIAVTVNTFMPVSPALGAPTATSGSVAYTVTDGSLPQDGATVSALAGSSMYDALIDGSSFMTLLDDPTSLVAAAGGSNTTTADFGLPGQTTVGPAISTSMEITYEFLLTGSDLVSITGNFVALPIPEPSSVLLATVGLALAACAAVRKAR